MVCFLQTVDVIMAIPIPTKEQLVCLIMLW